jgi:hypothetical protein
MIVLAVFAKLNGAFCLRRVPMFKVSFSAVQQSGSAVV